MRALVLLLCVVLVACEGTAALQGANGTGPITNVALPAALDPQITGMRRLTRVELDATLADLFGDTSSPAQRLLTPDPTDPFDNDYESQLPSAALIEGVENLAVEVADRALADSSRRLELIGCNPSGPGDTACFTAFVREFGRRVIRRPLTDPELTALLSLQSLAVEDNSFDTGVKLVIRTLLQLPEFLYRVELGVPESGRPGVYRLSAYELATRLSYFLHGTTPPEWLLDEAQNGGLASTDGVRAAAERLMGDTRTRVRVQRFHALWLGYHRLPHDPALSAAMQIESDALVKRVLFDEGKSYFELFNAQETYVNAQLAQHYGLSGAPSTGAAWVPYLGTRRQGLLSHGSVLSAGAKFSDTSPTQRGIFVRTRLLCQTVSPPPANVNADQPPTSTTSPCKKERYAVHASTGNCHSCHQGLDPVGFGLEAYDQAGRFRATDKDLPQCPIDGEGTVAGLPGGDVAFNGPDGLSKALTESSMFDRCVVTQVMRFADGRREKPEDQAAIDRFTDGFRTNNRDFRALLLDVVTDEAFAFRTEEP
jgi:hypothetical protein